MSDDPPVLEQPTDTPPAQPTVHRLSVTPEYVLGSLDFAAPPLTQNHVLSVKDYIVGPLMWSAPAMVRWRQHEGSVGGRPSKFSAELAAKLIPMVEQYVVEKQPASDLKILGTTIPLVNYARKLAAAEGITVVADVTLIRYLTRPAVKNIRLKAAAEKTT